MLNETSFEEATKTQQPIVDIPEISLETVKERTGIEDNDMVDAIVAYLNTRNKKRLSKHERLIKADDILRKSLGVEFGFILNLDKKEFIKIAKTNEDRFGYYGKVKDKSIFDMLGKDVAIQSCIEVINRGIGEQDFVLFKTNEVSKNYNIIETFNGDILPTNFADFLASIMLTEVRDLNDGNIAVDFSDPNNTRLVLIDCLEGFAMGHNIADGTKIIENSDGNIRFSSEDDIKKNLKSLIGQKDDYQFKEKEFLEYLNGEYFCLLDNAGEIDKHGNFHPKITVFLEKSKSVADNIIGLFRFLENIPDAENGNAMNKMLKLFSQQKNKDELLKASFQKQAETIVKKINNHNTLYAKDDSEDIRNCKKEILMKQVQNLIKLSCFVNRKFNFPLIETSTMRDLYVSIQTHELIDKLPLVNEEDKSFLRNLPSTISFSANIRRNFTEPIMNEALSVEH